jgi:hypothetical protein
LAGLSYAKFTTKTQKFVKMQNQNQHQLQSLSTLQSSAEILRIDTNQQNVSK